MADELNKPGSVRDGMVTFRIPLDQAAQLKELAAELDTPVSALMQRAVKELIAKRGHFDPEQIKLQEVEVNTFGAVYRVTDQILYPLFDRISKHVEVLEYIGQMLSVLKVQAKDLLEDKEDLETFFKALEERTNFEPPARPLSEAIEISIAAFLERRKERPEPPKVGYSSFGLPVLLETEKEDLPKKGGTAEK